MEIKLTTKNMAYMAMFAAMQVVLEYCTKFYEMPKGGNCAFSLVAIILWILLERKYKNDIKLLY